MAWAVVFPMDCLKTRAQAGMIGSSPAAIAAAAVQIARKEGARSFYAGVSAAVARAFVANAALFWGLETSYSVMAGC